MIGKTISHYKILQKLGEGGMGVVYRAEDTKLHRLVALKFLSPEMTRDETAKNRFIEEARSVSSLDHPNIAVVHEVDETSDGRAFICMAYYDGQTIKQKIEKGPLSIDESVQIAYQIADGLQRAHEAGVVHRDIKPANIIITERNQAKIVDFGIARLADETKYRSPSETAGTAAYMSPEQAQGAPADHRSDLFSLGIVLYEMITGRRPFQGEHEAAVLYSVVNTEPPKPSLARREVPPALDKVILRLLEKNPDRRYQSAAEVQNDLGLVLGLEPQRVLTAPSRWNRMLRIVIPALGLAMIIAVVPAARDYIAMNIRSIFIPPHKTVVILPFLNLTEDSLSRDLSIGLTSTMTSKLSQIERFGHRLAIVPASSVRESRIRTTEDARDKFAATHVVSGEVQLIDQRIRVTMNLVDARRLTQISSDVEDYSLLDLAAIQDQASERLAGILDIDLVEPLRSAFVGAGTKNSDAFRFYAQGRSYLARHEQVANINMAIGLFERALKSDSAYGLAYAGLGEAYWRKYRRTKDTQWTEPATRACTRALELVPDLPETHVTLGLIYQGTGQYDRALEENLRALGLNEDHVDALIGMGNAYESLGQTIEADSAYRRAIAVAPGYWDAYNNYGYFLLFQGRVGSAIAQFRTVTELAPDNIIGYNNLGGALMYDNRWMQAKDVFEKSLALTPSSSAIANLGTIYFYYEKSYEKAVQAYEQGVRLDPRDYRLWGNLGSAYYQIPGMGGKMREAFRQAIGLASQNLRINANDVSLLADLAKYHATLGEKKMALEYATRAGELDDVSTESIESLIEAYEHLQMRHEALEWVKRGLRYGLSPDLIERSPQMAGLVSDSAYVALMAKRP